MPTFQSSSFIALSLRQQTTAGFGWSFHRLNISLSFWRLVLNCRRRKERLHARDMTKQRLRCTVALFVCDLLQERQSCPYRLVDFLARGFASFREPLHGGRRAHLDHIPIVDAMD